VGEWPISSFSSSSLTGWPVKLAQNLIQDFGLFAGRLPHAGGVVHDDQGEHGGKGKDIAARAGAIADGGDQTTDHGGMAAGHTASADKHPQIEIASQYPLEKKLIQLHDKTGAEGKPEHGIGPKKLHGLLILLSNELLE
jgi:hypothetical protein